MASGGDDYVVGLEPFTEDTLLIFLRKSIMRLGGVSGSLADTDLSVVTPELGCAARRTIVQVGNKVYFLSDNGVYGLEYLDAYNLRGLEMPLSEAINPTISRINTEAIDKAVAQYTDNRLYFAVPVDGARENNLILVYNLLNGGWESIDHVESTNFNIRDMIVAQEGEKNKLYITTSEGGVHEIEGFSGGDQISVSAGVTIPETLDVNSKLVTREYDADTIDRKVFSRTELHVESSDSLVSNAEIAFSTTDPDRTRTAVSMSDLLGSTLSADEDASLRTNIRLRGYGCSVSITPTQGRPTFKAVKVDAHHRPLNNFHNLNIMAILNNPEDFVSGENITAAKLNNLVDGATFLGGAGQATDDSTLEVNDGVGGDGSLRVKDLGITSAKIADDAVIESKIADNAVIESKIADNAVTASKIAPSAATAIMPVGGVLPYPERQAQQGGYYVRVRRLVM